MYYTDYTTPDTIAIYGGHMSTQFTDLRQVTKPFQ